MKRLLVITVVPLVIGLLIAGGLHAVASYQPASTVATVEAASHQHLARTLQLSVGYSEGQDPTQVYLIWTDLDGTEHRQTCWYSAKSGMIYHFDKPVSK